MSALLGMNGSLFTVTGEPFSAGAILGSWRWCFGSCCVIKAWIDCSVANSDCVFMIPCLSLEPAGAGTLQKQ